jgi:hypothetical protein
LAVAATARDGVEADVLLPDVAAELARIGGTVSLAVVDLVAAPSPLPPEP